MIIARWEAPCTLSVEGHAGYAERGKDIVCAGMSTLWGTLLAELDEQERQGRGKVCVSGGTIRFETADESDIQRIYAMIWRGILLLAVSYGDYVDAKRTW